MVKQLVLMVLWLLALVAVWMTAMTIIVSIVPPVTGELMGLMVVFGSAVIALIIAAKLMIYITGIAALLSAQIAKTSKELKNK